MQRIAIYSASGGVGKSFIAANLAASLFQRGFPVVLCELSSSSLLPVHFGGGLQMQNDTSKGVDEPGSDKVEGSNELAGSNEVAANNEVESLQTFSLHRDFVLLTPNPSVGSTSDQLLLAAVHQAKKLQRDNGFIIFDIATHTQFNNKSPLFNLGLEIVAADPVSVAAACNNNLIGAKYRMAHKHYLVLNKKDLRSRLSEDSAIMVEACFGEQLLGAVHYDSNVPEAFASKSLVTEHAPQCQAADDMNGLTNAMENLIRKQGQ